MKALRIGSISLIILFFTVVRCHESQASVIVKASVDKRIAYIGDRIRLTIDIRSSGEIEIAAPDFPSDKIGDFEIKASGRKDTRTFLRAVRINQWYDLSLYETGKRTIPSVVITYRSPGAAWYQAKTDPIIISISSLLSSKYPDKDIRGIKGLRDISASFSLVIAGIIAAIAIGLIGLFNIIRLVGSRKRYSAPHLIALREIEEACKAFADMGDVKVYYDSVSGAVRRYIEASFRITAPNMTTDEFLAYIERSNALIARYRDPLVPFLRSCDLVKFAGYSPLRNERDSIVITAKQFIKDTTPTSGKDSGAR